MRRLTVFALSLVLLSTAAVAQTYRWVDPATGKTMITDTPPPGSVKKVDKARDDSSDPNAALGATVKRAVENFPVTLYTASECVDECKQARDLLNKRGVPFSEKMLQKREEMAELKAMVGEMVVPVLKVGNQTVKGFLAESYNNLLDLAGYPKTAPFGAKPSGGLSQ